MVRGVVAKHRLPESTFGNVDKTLYHTMGKSDPTRTILTEEEFCEILTEIRKNLQKET